jgi:Iron-containing redox enzyme
MVSEDSGRFSDCLRRKIALVSPAQHRENEIWHHPKLRSFYAELMLTEHAIVRASVPLMKLAQEQALRFAPADMACTQFAGWLETHIEEEAHHDEWLLEDLEYLGVSHQAALRRLPSPRIAQLVGAQYYWIQHVDPFALLGYIAVLEGEPIRRQDLESAVARTGLPQAAFRTFFQHSDLDAQHSKDLERVLDDLPLSSQRQTLISVSAMLTVHWLGGVFAELLGPYCNPA